MLEFKTEKVHHFKKSNFYNSSKNICVWVSELKLIYFESNSSFNLYHNTVIQF